MSNSPEVQDSHNPHEDPPAYKILWMEGKGRDTRAVQVHSNSIEYLLRIAAVCDYCRVRWLLYRLWCIPHFSSRGGEVIRQGGFDHE